MENLILKRTYFKDATVGHLFMEDRSNPVWCTIERPWLDNTPFKSCIPEGRYLVEPFSGDRYKEVWQVKDVPNRTAILFHVGNWARNSVGCILPGLSFGYMKDHEVSGQLEKAVMNSGQAILQIKRELGYPSSFNLNITS